MMLWPISVAWQPVHVFLLVHRSPQQHDCERKLWTYALSGESIKHNERLCIAAEAFLPLRKSAVPSRARKRECKGREVETCGFYFFINIQCFVFTTDSGRGEHQEVYSRDGPLPDLLPQNELPSWASPHHGAPREEALQELEIRRVASQLRAIGDEFNATVLRRAVSRGTRGASAAQRWCLSRV